MNTYWHDFIGGWVGGKLLITLNITGFKVAFYKPGLLLII